MKVRVKICGLTEPAGVAAAAAAGADALGFVFAESPRRVEPSRAAELVARLDGSVDLVAVFRLPSRRDLEEALDRFRPDWLQFEFEMAGLVPEAYRHRFLPVFHDAFDVEDRISAYLADATHRPAVLHLEGPGRGGRGIPVDLERAARIAARHPTVLAGGLDPAGVTGVVRAVRPAGVDVSSGVESTKGVKDPERIRNFVAAVRAAERPAGPVAGKEFR